MDPKIREALYERYIIPTEEKRADFVGIEIEMPIVNLKGEATDHEVSKEVFREALTHFGMTPKKYDRKGFCHEAADEGNGDILSFDCSYNNLEISFGTENSLIPVEERFYRYIAFFNEKLSSRDHLVTGMGIQPFYNKCRKDYIETGRYEMLGGYLNKCSEWRRTGGFHEYPGFGTFASSTQIQLDIKKEDLIDTVSTFSLIEPVKSLLFANSPMIGDEPGMLLTRDLLWEYSTHGINPKNIGAYEKIPETIEEFLDHISYTSLFCTERDGKYLFFYPVPVADYFSKEKIEAEYIENGVSHKYEIKPDIKDLSYLRTYKFLDLTSRGTIEYRSLCTQPLNEILSGVAFQLGLRENIEKLKELLAKNDIFFGHSFSVSELRRSFNKGIIPSYIDSYMLKRQLVTLIRLSEDGLKKRGYGEEKFIKCLYSRAEELKSPAKNELERLASGESITDIIYSYSVS